MKDFREATYGDRIAEVYDEMLAGMRLRHRWSDWRRAPFTASSANHVSVYELR